MSNCEILLLLLPSINTLEAIILIKPAPQTFTKHKNHMHLSSFFISMIPSGYLLNIKKKPVASFSVSMFIAFIHNFGTREHILTRQIVP
jgi:hypothetical protein